MNTIKLYNNVRYTTVDADDHCHYPGKKQRMTSSNQPDIQYFKLNFFNLSGHPKKILTKL